MRVRQISGIFEGPHYGYQCNAIASRIGAFDDVSVKDFAERRQKTYRIACKVDVCGVRTTVVETHLDLAADARRAQIAALADEFGACGHVILSGDFNVDDGSEFAPFRRAGFSAANLGCFGTFNTHRRRRMAITPAIDNVLVKGFDILDVWMADNALLLSDHRLLVCRLAAR